MMPETKKGEIEILNLPFFTFKILLIRKPRLLCLHMALGASGWTGRFVGLL